MNDECCIWSCLLRQGTNWNTANFVQWPLLKDVTCAAKALFSCPAIISQRLESRIISNEPLENTEEESKIIQARSHITLEKSSRNYKPLMNKPNQTSPPARSPPPRQCLGMRSGGPARVECLDWPYTFAVWTRRIDLL